ncbi:hypothetical protein LTR66_009515 [Elasticomyces elasticus]|nr:hypothetical protein LTR66_009515 [Elasticomyces elasticus]
MRCQWGRYGALPLFLISFLPVRVIGADVLKTDGFSSCSDNPTITVNRMNIQYDKTTNEVTFNVAGSSSQIQNVTANMTVFAYGKPVYNKAFNPCDTDSYVAQLCPVPAGNFSAVGVQAIPSSYTSMIPSIAFSVPDLDGQAKLELTAEDGKQLACIESTVNNGKTMSVPAVSYIAVGIAGAAFILSALSVLGSGGHAGSAQPSPTFGEVLGWFQGMAMNGMHSVAYPAVYHSFAKNFAFSTGLIPWGSMQTTIDDFRQKTGGNLTDNNYQFLKNNATLVYSDANNRLTRRSMDDVLRGIALLARDVSTSVNGTSSSLGGDSSASNSSATESKTMHYVHGIQAYVEQLAIPQANTFMTVLLFFALIVAAITIGILLFKVILETWALFGTFPKSLTSFRKRYWWRLAKTITGLIFLLYGVWTLYCVYQFTNGDSWAAKLLAGVTLTVFTAILAGFTFTIWRTAQRFKKLNGDVSALFDNKQTWVKYSIFYDTFKINYWWLFVPAIVYMFAKGCVIAGLNGHGLWQTAGQLIIESLMLILLLWTRPYSLKSGNWINIFIQVVRVLSVVCILIFVEELGINQTTKTITGVVLIVVQSVLTGVLAILIAVNGIIVCVRANPHRQKRKQAEKLNRDLDNLTPLDARNSLLMDQTPLTQYKGDAAHPQPQTTKASLVSSSLHMRGNSAAKGRYNPLPHRPASPASYADYGRGGRPAYLARGSSSQRLVTGAASMAGRDERSRSPSVGRYSDREPTLPDVDLRPAR